MNQQKKTIIYYNLVTENEERENIRKKNNYKKYK